MHFFRFLPSLLVPFSAIAQRGPVPGLDTNSPYLIYYGNWDVAKVTAARMNYRLVILHPISNITPANVAEIKRGPDNAAGTLDDVKVLAYISVGEDARPGAPFSGNLTGPRMDPRAADSLPLAGISPAGVASSGGTGYASYYLDDNDLNGLPDQNSIFGGYFVNAGDPAWYQIVKTSTKAFDGLAGLEELMTSTAGFGYNCDGVFLDTLDTPAPNSFGATRFEWTTQGFQTLVKNISDEYPSRIILGNRGLFFYNPNLKNYAFTLRPYVNILLFESYYTDSDDSTIISPFFDDNKHNWAPKLNAEAGRSDGFTVLGLGYDHPSTTPQAIKDQDFVECMENQGWPLYRTNRALNTDFSQAATAWLATHADSAAPVWDSTAATIADSDPGTPGNQPPVPRTGIQQAVPGDGKVTLRWDVARDQTLPIKYNVYYTAAPPLNFATASKLPAVPTGIPSNYLGGTGAGRYPHEVTVTGLTNGQTYEFAIRAEDSAAIPHEDTNTVSLMATPVGPPSYFATMAVDGAFSDWAAIPVLYTDEADGTAIDYRNVSLANDANFLYIRFTLETPASPFSTFSSHIFIDRDANAATGFLVGGSTVGSELMLELVNGYDQRNGGFNEGSTTATGLLRAPLVAATEHEIRVSLATLYADNSAVFTPGSTIRVLLQDNGGGEITGSSGILYKLATPPPPPAPVFAHITVDGLFADWNGIPPRLTQASSGAAIDFATVRAANDNEYLYVRFTLHSPAAAFSDFNGHFFVDRDATASTGYLVPGSNFGSEAFVELGAGYDQRNGSFNAGSLTATGWAVAPFGIASDFELRFSRSTAYADLSKVFNAPSIRFLLQDNRGSALAGAGGVPYTFATGSPYENWRSQQFNLAALENPAVSGPLSDPDGDGLSNLLEYAHDLSPNVAGLSGLPRTALQPLNGSTYLTLTYTRRTGASGLSYTPEVSTDLATWNRQASQFIPVSTTSLGNGLESITLRRSTPTSLQQREFFHVQISLVPQ